MWWFWGDCFQRGCRTLWGIRRGWTCTMPLCELSKGSGGGENNLRASTVALSCGKWVFVRQEAGCELWAFAELGSSC